MISHTTHVTVRWGDVDPAGIVFYPRFYAWYDLGTETLFESIGLPFPELFERHAIVGVPIVESGSTFVSPARWGDVLAIRSTIAWVKDKTLRVDHDVRQVAHEVLREEPGVLQGEPGVAGGDRVCARGFEVRAWVRRPATPGGPLHADPIPSAVRDRLRA